MEQLDDEERTKLDLEERKELDLFRRSTILSLLRVCVILLAFWKWPQRLPRTVIKAFLNKLSQAPIAHRYEPTYTHARANLVFF